MSAMASQIDGVSIVCSLVHSSPDQKKISKLRVTGLCEGNPPVTGGFPSLRDSIAENDSIWWHHCVLALIVSGSSNPASMYGASLGVFCGTISNMCMMLPMILLILVCSLFVCCHTSLLYVIVGWMQQHISFKMILISMYFILFFPAMDRLVWNAASVFGGLNVVIGGVFHV